MLAAISMRPIIRQGFVQARCQYRISHRLQARQYFHFDSHEADNGFKHEQHNETTSNQEIFKQMTMPDLVNDDVCDKLEKLRQSYDPKELALLEYIIRTRPKRAYNPRIWYLVLKGLQIDGPGDSWAYLTPVQKRFYEDCAEIDRRRYKFEKNAWLTKLLSIDLEADELTLPDFEITEANSNVGALRSIIELNKDISPTSPRLKRPPSAFSLFLKDYSPQDDKYSNFRSDNLKRSSDAWNKLPDDAKQKYIEQSLEMRKNFKEERLFMQLTKRAEMHMTEISAGLFRHSKVNNGPSRPSHLYRLRLPRVEHLYGRANKISAKDRQRVWEALSEKEKEPYYKEHKAMEETVEAQRQMIREKLAYLNQLIYKANQLERLKRQSGLIKPRKRDNAPKITQNDQRTCEAESYVGLVHQKEQRVV